MRMLKVPYYSKYVLISKVIRFDQMVAMFISYGNCNLGTKTAKGGKGKCAFFVMQL